MMQKTSELYDERVVQLSDCILKILTYRLARNYVCIVSNLDPSATICRTKADSEENAVKEAMEIASERLRSTASRSTPIVLNSGSDLAIVRFDSPTGIQSFTPEEFRQLEHETRAEMFLSGKLTFLDSKGMTVSSGESVRLLLTLM